MAAVGAGERHEPGDRAAIRVEVRLAQPPQRVWRALTDPALVARWLMPTDIRPEVGRHFTFQAPSAPGWDGVVHCEVLAADPPRLLRHSWRGGSAEARGYGHQLDTSVAWTLTPTAEDGTSLQLVHDGFTAADHVAWDGLGRGWRAKLPTSFAQLVATIA